MPYVTCPGCDDELYIGGEPRLGQKVVCGECDARLEVVSLDPLEVDFPSEDDDGDE